MFENNHFLSNFIFFEVFFPKRVLLKSIEMTNDMKQVTKSRRKNKVKKGREKYLALVSRLNSVKNFGEVD